MGQTKVLSFLKKHPLMYFTAEQVMHEMSINIQTANKNLNGLVDSRLAVSRTLKRKDSNGRERDIREYAYKPKLRGENEINEINNLLKSLKSIPEHSMTNKNDLLSMLLLAEVRSINHNLEALRNGYAQVQGRSEREGDNDYFSGLDDDNGGESDSASFEFETRADASAGEGSGVGTVDSGETFGSAVGKSQGE